MLILSIKPTCLPSVSLLMYFLRKSLCPIFLMRQIVDVYMVKTVGAIIIVSPIVTLQGHVQFPNLVTLLSFTCLIFRRLAFLVHV